MADTLAVREPNDDMEEDVEEELEDLPEEEKMVDPLRHAKIRRIVNGEEFDGEVEDIEQGKISKDRLYRIKYSDGDLEHLTEEQVRAALSSPLQEGAGEAEDDEEVDGEDEEDSIAKRPASKSKAKAAAKDIAKKPVAAPNAAAAKGKAKAKGKAAPKAMMKKPAGR